MNIGNDPPDVTVSVSGSSIAGAPLSLTCNVILAQVLRERPVIEWVWPNRTKIENGTLEGVSVFSSSPSTTVTLIFTPYVSAMEVYTGAGLVLWILMPASSSVLTPPTISLFRVSL